MTALLRYITIIAVAWPLFAGNKLTACEISDILRDAPGWGSVPIGDDYSACKFLDAFSPLLAKDTAELRDGILKYIKILR